MNLLDILPAVLVNLIMLMNKPTVRSTIEDFLERVDHDEEEPMTPENEWGVTRFRLEMPTAFARRGLTIVFNYAQGELFAAFCSGDFVGCLLMKRGEAIQKFSERLTPANRCDIDSFV